MNAIEQEIFIFMLQAWFEGEDVTAWEDELNRIETDD